MKKKKKQGKTAREHMAKVQNPIALIINFFIFPCETALGCLKERESERAGGRGCEGGNNTKIMHSHKMQ